MSKNRHSGSRRAKFSALNGCRRLPLVEILENRQLLSTFYVTNTHDHGYGSLRFAINQANSDPIASGHDLIESNPTSLGTIFPNSALPALTRANVTIEAVNIDGTGGGGEGAGSSGSNSSGGNLTSANGLSIQGSSDAVVGVGVTGFGGSGIYVSAGSVQIAQSQITNNGQTATNGAPGLNVTGDQATIDGNTITGNVGPGIALSGNQANLSSNVVTGNSADGIDVYGSNDLIGVIVDVSGPSLSSGGNQISANGGDGIAIYGPSASGNTIQGNLVGTDQDGVKALGNSLAGVLIDSGAVNNTIGGSAPGAGNLISGNLGAGFVDDSSGSQPNYFSGNRVGVTRSGSSSLTNSGGAMAVSGGASVSMNSSSVISGGIMVQSGAIVNISSENNIIHGKLTLESNGGLNFLSSSNSVTGGVSAKSGGALSVFDNNNRVNGGIFIAGGNVTVFGFDDSLSGPLDIAGSGLLKLTGTSDRYSGSGSEAGDAAVQVLGRNNALYGSLTIAGGASVTLGSNAFLAGVVTVTDFGGVDITGSHNRIAGGINLEDGRAMTIGGSHNAVSGYLTDSGGAPIRISSSLMVLGGTLTLDSNVVVSGNLDVTAGGEVTINGTSNKISGNVTLGGSRHSGGGGVGEFSFSSGSGALRVYGPSNTITGSLFVIRGSVTVSGPGTSLAVNGEVTISAGSLTADGDGTLDLPELTSINSSQPIAISADGPNSVLDLSGLTSWSTTSPFSFYSSGYQSSLTVTNGATVVENANLTTLHGVDVTLDGTSKLAVSQWTALTDGSLKITGGDYAPTSGTATSANSFSSLSNINGSGIYVSGGSLTLPAVVTYNPQGGFVDFSASGSGAKLSLPGLTEVNASGSHTSHSDYYSGSKLNFVASSGGVFVAPSLILIQDSDFTSIGAVATGTNSLVDLSSLATFFTYNGILSASQGGTIEFAPGLDSIESVSITVDGTSSMPLDQFIALEFDNLTIEGGTWNLPSLAFIDNTSVYVEGGGSLTLSGVTSYTNNNYTVTYLEAVDTTDGGTLDLPNLQTISSPYDVDISAAGSSSEIDLPALISFSTTETYYYDGYASSLSVTQGANVEDGNLTTLSDVEVTLDGTGTLPVSQWTNFNFGVLSITGGDYSPTSGAATPSNSFANLSNIDGSSLFVSGGSLSLPDVMTYQALNDPFVLSQSGNIFEATGMSSVLSLPALASIANSNNNGYAPLTIEASSGGDVELACLTSINTSGDDAPVSIESSDAGSLIDLPALLTYDVADPDYDGAILSATANGTIELDLLLTSLNGVLLVLDGTGNIPISQFASVTNGGIEIESGDYAPAVAAETATNSLPNLSNINGSSLLVESGGSLSLPEVMSYQALYWPSVFAESGNVFEATGSGSTLSLPGLASIADSVTNQYAPLTIEASSGGDVELVGLTSINTTGFDAPVSIESTGENSLIDIPLLTTYEVTDPGYAGAILEATSSGAIDLSAQLTSLDGVNLTLDGTGTISVSQFTSITNGGITVEAGDYSTGTPFAALTDIDGSNLQVDGGGNLDLPGVKTYTNSSGTTSFQAFGQSNTYPYPTTVGTLDLPALMSVAGFVNIAAQGAGSEIDLPLIPSLGGGSLAVTLDATIVAPDLTALNDATVTLDGTGTIATSQWQSLTHGSLTITGGNYASTISPPFSALTDIDDSSLYVYGGGSLALPGVTSYVSEGNTFQAEQYPYFADTEGTLSLPNLMSIGGYGLSITAFGPGSVVSLPALETFTSMFNDAVLSVTDSGTVDDGALTTLTGVAVTLDGTGTMQTAQWTSLTDGSLAVTAGHYSSTSSPPFAALSDIDGSSVYVYGGGSLTLPAVASYTNNTNGYVYLEGDYPYYYNGTIGVLNLPGLLALGGSDIVVAAQGSGSEVNLPLLTTVDFGQNGTLTFTNDGVLSTPSLSTLVNVTVTTDSTASFILPADQSFSFPVGTSTINTGAFVDQGSIQLGRTEPFTLASYSSGGTGVIQTASASQPSPSSFDIPVSIADPTEVYTLINSAYGEFGDLVGAVEFEATGGLVYTVDLVEGQNIRDHNNDGYNNAIGQGALGTTYLGTASFGGGQVRLDEQGFVLPAAFQSATLTDIILLGYGNVPAGEPFLAAATVGTPGGPVAVALGSLVNGNLQTYANGSDYPLGGTTIEANATVQVSGNFEIDGSGALSVEPGSTFAVSGNLLGGTTNAAGFNPLGTVTFDGNGTSSSPQQLEVMSQDLGDIPAGFQQNFAYDTLELSGNTYLELVDNSVNSPGNAPEALYVNHLIVPAGTTLNLNGLNLYIHTANVQGTILGGAIITGEVYSDSNSSGTLTAGDSGLAGWTVTLTNTSTNATYTTVTDSNGDYAFAGIQAGSYTLSEVLQSGFAQTAPAAPGTYSLTISSGQVLSNQDFGDHATASISGVVFDDSNADGTLDNGELGLSGWTVQLSNSAHQVISTFLTSSGGSYSFTGLFPGTYTVQIVAQSGFTATTSTSVQLTDSNGQAETVNFGEFQPISVSGQVFVDNNGDGMIDGSDAGLSGWSVTLKNGSQSLETTTGPGGAFTFSGVGPGNFTVQAVQQTGYIATTSPVVEAPSGSNITGLALGEFQTVAISGEVYDDLNDSGTLASNDPGLSGWTVKLTSGSQNLQTTTDSSGDYTFAGVGPGSFTITDVLQPGFVQTAPNTGSISGSTSSGVNLSAENFGAIQAALLSVTRLAVTPSTLQSGATLVVSWDDANAGNSTITSSFADHVVITNKTTGVVLGVADVPYDVNTRGGLASGSSALEQYAFQLPDGYPGVGNIEFTVTADAYDAVSAGLSASGRTSSVMVASTLANYADLAASNVSAPATAKPNQTVFVTWTDSNSGNAGTPASWVDEILLSYDGTISNAVPVGTLAVTGPIAAGSSTSEQAQVTIPVTGPASSGSLQFVVIANANQSFFELDTTNNPAIDPSATIVPLTLTLTTPVTSIAENALNPQILSSVSRNGPTSQPLTVNLASSNTSQFTVPATVTIPAGQSYAPVTITVQDDGLVDANQADSITASASTFTSSSVSITDLNTDQAALTLSIPNPSTPIPKGGFAIATVSLNLPASQDTTVSLSGNDGSRVYAPTTVTIPAGQTSTSFDLRAIDDDVIEGNQAYAITAAAPGVAPSTLTFSVADTDIPNLSLTLGQTTVSETAGSMATQGTITPSFVSDQPIVVALSVPSGSPATVPATIIIPANATSVTFPIGTFDNGSNLVTQAVPILAEVTTALANVPLAQGSTTATLDVVNTNGPTLQVTFASNVVTQGQASATTGTVTIENATAPSSPLTVTLMTSDATEATVPATVTIAAGHTSATFTVGTPADTMDLGTVQPTITASASAFAPGQAQLIVTDAPAADLLVSTVTADATALNGQLFNVSYTVTNQGTAPAVGPWQDQVFITNQPTGGALTPLGAPIAFNGTMAPGLFYSRSLSFFAPEETGNYWIVVQTSVGNTVTEAVTSNDSTVSPQPVNVLPSYTATVQADVPVSLMDTPVPLSGSATLAGGGPAKFDLVNIHVFTAGTERIFSALTDQNGNFTATFTPLPGEAGVYTVGATNPGVAQASVQGGFDILGMTAQPPSASLSLVAGSPAQSGQITLTNATDIPLSNLQASVLGAPSSLSVGLTLGDGTSDQELSGNATLSLSYTVSASNTSTPSGTFTIQVQSAEGATVDIPVSFTVIALAPDVVASPSSLQAGMISGSQSVVEFTLTNQGAAPSGPLDVELPPNYTFLSLASASAVPSLAPGASTQITLLLTPTPDLPLAKFSGNIIVQGSTATTVVPFSFINLSTATGDLQITTVDEFTYYAQGSPNLAGASVTVTNSLSQQVAATGTTNANGFLDVPDLPEGYYDVHIIAPQHASYDATIFINPGLTTPVTAFLSAQVVQYNFTVLPAEIPDETKIDVESTFQTNVPAPVIVVTPDVFDLGSLNTVGEVEQINVTIANHGLIAAQDMTIGIPTHPYYSFTPLISNIGTLPADSSITIPVIIRRIAVPDALSLIDTTPGAVADPGAFSESGASVGGGSLSAQDAAIPWSLDIPVDWELVCGPGDEFYSINITCINIAVGECPPGMPMGVQTSPGGGAFGFGTIVTTPTVGQPAPCDPLIAAVFNAIKGQLPSSKATKILQKIATGLKYTGPVQIGPVTISVKMYNLPLGGTNPGAQADGGDPGNFGLLMTQLTEAEQVATQLELLTSGNGGLTGGSAVASGGLSGSLNQLDTYINDLKALINSIDYIFGSPDWINQQTGPNFDAWMAAFTQVATSTDSSGNVTTNLISSDDASQLESMTLPEGVSLADVQYFIARWNNTYNYNLAGIYSASQLSSGQDPNFVATDTFATNVQAALTAQQQLESAGFSDYPDALSYVENQIYSNATLTQVAAGGVCATVKIQINQTAVVTRQAFDATLTIDNGEMMPLQNIELNIVVTDYNGDNVTNLFDVESPILEGLNDVSGNGTLAEDTDGSAEFTLVPTDAAAPSVATSYYVSATLSYTYQGMDLTVPFAASEITVDPNPSLTLRYFMQRDVYGPDPSNPSLPSEPFILGVQVLNSGAGTADNVQITSAQPEIISNEKGLLANFQIIATQVNGQNLSPSLTVNFGSIAPGGVSTALFYLTSSIQGQFIDFEASYEDESGLGSPQVSIINGIQINELIHVGQGLSPSDVGKSDFLVDTIPNPFGTPDTIFLPDGSSQPVAQAANPSFDSSPGPGNLTIHLTDTPSSGWSYLDVPDPGNGNYQLVSVTRSDGVALPVADFWQTDRTFVGGAVQPIYQNNLHILDDNSAGSYTLVYAPMNGIQPMVTRISSVSPNPTTTPVDSLQVTFNEPIALGTFDSNDLSLSLNNGPNLITSASGISVSLVSGSTYEISGLSGIDIPNGVYTLTVYAAGIQDALGDSGSGTLSTNWVMASNAPAVQTISGVTPGPRNTAVDSLEITFTEPIDSASFGIGALSLTRNGAGPNLIAAGSGVTIMQLGPATFQVSGLGALSTPDGSYAFSVDASQVTSSGTPGIGTGSVDWTMDTTAPLVEYFSTVASPRNTPADNIDVTFSKPIDPQKFTTGALSLTLGGGNNLITNAVTISLVSGATYQISGLSAIDTANGIYLLTVIGADVTDLAGNAGANSLETAWVMETTVPAAPSNLAITPNTGISPGLTDTGALTLTGSLAGRGFSVDVFDVTTNLDLGPAPVTGTSFSFPLNLPAGTTELALTAEDSAGNISAPADFTIFVDETAPTIASFTPVSPNPTNMPVGAVDVTFSKPINPTTFTTANLTLTDNGSATNLISNAVTISLVAGTSATYQIGGLSGITSAEGTYTLTVSATGIQDQAGNSATGSLSTTWLMDTTPPTSTVNSLPTPTSSPTFLVSASGSDPNGSNDSTASGIASFTLYASKDGGPFMPFATVTPANPSASFTGQGGHTYGFYSIATDNAGNVQATPTAAQQTVQILSPLSVTSFTAVSPNPRHTAVSSVDVTFSEPVDLTTFTYADLTLTDNGGGSNLITNAVTISLVSGSTYQINLPSALTTANGTYSLTVNATDIKDQNGVAGTNFLSTSWLMDATSPTSHVVNSLGTSQSTDSFSVTVSYTDPTSGLSPASGVSSVDLYYSVNNGPFTLYQTNTITPSASGTTTFTFTGQDRNLYAFHSVAHDAAGNTENKSGTAVEASTTVPDLNPPVTHVLSSSPSYSWGSFPSSNFSSLTASSYANGVFTINWAGADPDQNSGTPSGSISLVNIYVQVDGGTPVLIGQPGGGTPSGNGVYSGTLSYNALGDGLSHTYSFFSVGVDDQQKKQYAPAAGPAAPDVTFSSITFTKPLGIQSFAVEKGIAERSFIQYLDVNFNQTLSSTPPSSALQGLAAGLAGSTPSSYVELLFYGENLSSSSVPQGSVNLFNTGTTASVGLSGNDLSINFGPNGITSLLAGAPASPTGKIFGDGWYALGIDASGNPQTGPTFWLTFFRLLGDTNGDGVVTGPYTTAGTDAYTVYHAEGQSGSLLNADVDGSGAVNSKDLSDTILAKGDSVGATAPQNFPAFQLFAGASALHANAASITQAQVQALLPEAIAAWRSAGLDATDLRRLETAKVQVANLGTNILGLEAANVITINQTAAGYNWYVNASARSSQAFSLAGTGTDRLAGPGSPAAGRVDLLTVLEHELGHVIGLADNNQAGDLMDTTLGLGVRRAPTAADVTTAFRPPSTLNPSAFNATVDAALDSITIHSVRLETKPQSRSSRSSATHPRGLIASQFRRNARRAAQAAAPDVKLSAKDRGN